MSIISNNTNAKKKLHQPVTYTLWKNGFDKSESKISWGMTNGKPKMAMSAELPPALLAIADNIVNKIDKLIPPKSTMPKNVKGFKQGLPNKKINKQ